MKQIMRRDLYLNTNLIQSTYIQCNYDWYYSMDKILFIEDKINNNCIYYKYLSKTKDINIRDIWENQLEIIKDNRLIIKYDYNKISSIKYDYKNYINTFKLYKSKNNFILTSKSSLTGKEIISVKSCEKIQKDLEKYIKYNILDNYNNTIYYSYYVMDSYYIPWWCKDLNFISSYKWYTDKNYIKVDWDISKRSSDNVIYINHKKDDYILRLENKIPIIPTLFKYYKGIKH